MPLRRNESNDKYFRSNRRKKIYFKLLYIYIYIYENSLFSLLHFNFSKLILSSIGRRKNFVRRTFLFFLERKFNSKIVSGKNNNFLTLRLFPFLVYFIEKKKEKNRNSTVQSRASIPKLSLYRGETLFPLFLFNIS